MMKVLLAFAPMFIAAASFAQTQTIGFDGEKAGARRISPAAIAALDDKALPSPAAPAADRAGLKVSCSAEKGVTLAGSVSEKTARFTISDPKKSLDISAALPAEFSFERMLRSGEEKYSFAKYYSDATHTEDLEFSLPRKVLAGEQTGRFPAYFTIYRDDGDHMVPDAGRKIDCRLERAGSWRQGIPTLKKAIAQAAAKEVEEMGHSFWRQESPAGTSENLILNKSGGMDLTEEESADFWEWSKGDAAVRDLAKSWRATAKDLDPKEDKAVIAAYRAMAAGIETDLIGNKDLTDIRIAEHTRQEDGDMDYNVVLATTPEGTTFVIGYIWNPY